MVVIPSRELVVIHPDLDYAEALGAVMGTLPDLHPDAAKALVDQVTPAPRRAPHPLNRISIVVCALALALPLAGAVMPAEATATFGPTWKQQMAMLGLECTNEVHDRQIRACLDADRDVHHVRGIPRPDGDLYLVSTDSGCHSVKVFDRERDAEEFAAVHPNVRQAGRVASW